MKLGITYDTKEDYSNIDYSKYCDFASLTSISFLKKQFEQAGFETQLIGSCDKLKQLLSAGNLNIDYIYNTAEGISSRNREGIIPALLEAYNIPYIGSDAYALSLTLNKYHTKLLAKILGVPTPNSEIIYLHDNEENIIKKIENLYFPLVVKPNYEGSSMGVYLVHTIDQCINKIYQNQIDYSQEILCEEYIEGIECTVPVIGNAQKTKALGVVEYYRSNGKKISLFESDDKHYTDIKCRKAEIPTTLEEELILYTKKLHQFLGCKDINRADYRITSDNKAYFLELNPLPALDPEGSFVCGAKMQGMDFPELLKLIVQQAVERYN